jgi:hypothetical protein
VTPKQLIRSGSDATACLLTHELDTWTGKDLPRAPARSTFRSEFSPSYSGRSALLSWRMTIPREEKPDQIRLRGFQGHFWRSFQVILVKKVVNKAWNYPFQN